MSIKNLWTGRDKPTISLEFFPARDEKAAKKLIKAIDSLVETGPDFVSVTFGAGGITRDGSYELAKMLVEEKKLRVLPYLAAYGLGPDEISTVIDRYKGLGIDNLFCVRGDEPENTDIQPHPNGFAYASDFLTFVNQKYDLFTGCAGYPEGHKDAESLEKDLEYLKLKVNNGARFIISQYVYDCDYFFNFVEKCRKMGINVPILAGVMPIYSIKMTKNLASLCNASITQEVTDGFEALPPDDKKAVTDFGVEFALAQCRKLIASGVDGIHFYTMDRAKSIVKIISQLKSEGLL